MKKLLLVKHNNEVYASIVDTVQKGEYIHLENVICVCYEYFNAIKRANDIAYYVNEFHKDGTLDKNQFDFQMRNLGTLVVPKIETKYDSIIFYDLPNNLPTE